MTIRVPARDHIVQRHGDDLVTLMQAAEIRGDHHDDVDGELLELYRAQIWDRFFPLAVKARKTIAAIGMMKSGKTTFLRQRMQTIPPDERIVTIEDSPEFGALPVRNRVALFFGGGNITAEDCVETTLRQGANRVAVQELRGEEAFAFLRLEASGHSGSFTSWHANPDDPWTPVALMAKSSKRGRGIPKDDLKQMFKGFVDIVAYMRDFSVRSVYYRGAQ
jgi:type IV secretion system protein VirB11